LLEQGLHHALILQRVIGTSSIEESPAFDKEIEAAQQKLLLQAREVALGASVMQQASAGIPAIGALSGARGINQDAVELTPQREVLTGITGSYHVANPETFEVVLQH
jgi:hypothetical protein